MLCGFKFACGVKVSHRKTCVRAYFNYYDRKSTSLLPLFELAWIDAEKIMHSAYLYCVVRQKDLLPIDQQTSQIKPVELCEKC